MNKERNINNSNKNEVLSYKDNAFILDIQRKVYNNLLKILEKKNIEIEKINIILGLSGGPDSTFLLTILNDINKNNFKVNNIKNEENLLQNKLNIVCVHINHQLREDAKVDEKIAQEYCKKLGYEFILKTEDIEKLSELKKESIETVAREFRYISFNEVGNRFNNNLNEATFIATAHIKNDNTETILMNIARGTGKKGLIGIKEISKNSYTNIDIIRPILNITKAKIEKYLKLKEINYAKDYTNFENDYTRNKFRNIIIPELNNMGYLVDNSIETLRENIIEEEAYFEEELNRNLNKLKITVNSDHSIILVDLKRIQNLHNYMKKRIILNIITKYLNDNITTNNNTNTNTNTISSVNINDIISLINTGINNKMFVLKNIKFSIYKEKNINKSSNKSNNKNLKKRYLNEYLKIEIVK